MKRFKNAFISFFTWMGLIYCVFMIDNANFNPFEWNILARSMFVMYSIIFGSVIAFFAFIDENMKL